MYSVNLWNSEPGTNDDCIMGADFENRDAAHAAFHDLKGLGFYMNREITTARAKGYELWIEVDGPDMEGSRCIQKETEEYRRREARGCSEAAMQAGMAFGCAGYNDMMGY